MILHPEEKAFYTVAEAAIRWCGEFNNEQEILKDVQLHGHSFTSYPCIAQRVKILFHAIDSGNMPYRIIGTPLKLEGPRFGTEDQNLTIAIDHRDLKAWFEQYAPEEHPPFLFDETFRPPAGSWPYTHDTKLLGAIRWVIETYWEGKSESQWPTKELVKEKLRQVYPDGDDLTDRELEAIDLVTRHDKRRNRAMK